MRIKNIEFLKIILVNNDDPRFPIWLPIPALFATFGWVFYSITTGSAEFFETLIWPGSVIFFCTLIATWLGWQIDID